MGGGYPYPAESSGGQVVKIDAAGCRIICYDNGMTNFFDTSALSPAAGGLSVIPGVRVAQFEPIPDQNPGLDDQFNPKLRQWPCIWSGHSLSLSGNLGINLDIFAFWGKDNEPFP